MHIDPAWVAAVLLFVTSTGGWVYTAIRNGKSQARLFGNLEGKVGGIVESLDTRMDGMGKSADVRMSGIETSVNNLSQRIDNFVDGSSQRGRRSKKP